MAVDDEYIPSPQTWVREQVEKYESSGGTEALTLRDTGLPVVLMTMRGRKSGKIRKVPVMRVEHDGLYAIVASKGGSDTHPEWYYNLKNNPSEVEIQDATRKFKVTLKEISGEERSIWWERAVAAYPPYAEYQAKTKRLIPVFLATPVTP